MSNYLDNDGLRQVLQSVSKRFADSEKSVFKTDSTWEADSLAILQGWISGNTATDPINSRTINNFDVYMTTDSNTQYYFDSGTWFSFAPDMSDYFTKAQSDTRYPSLAEFAALQEQVNDIDTESVDALSAADINAALVTADFPAIL
jgi:hypothetical protein